MMDRLNITLLGHRDHGKSTVIGRLLHDTNSVKEDRVCEVRETCRALSKTFEYAFLLDSFQEEREGGMTIDVIHAQIRGKRYVYNCIDVPGHRELIKNMLTGASHADTGILVVSAKEGIEAQTSQHLRLTQWLGIQQIIVAVNKMDLMGYEQKAFEQMKCNLSNLVATTVSDQVSYVPVSASEGDNVVTPSARMAWYRGPTLYELMENLKAPGHLSEMPFRLPIQDLYRGTNGERIIVGRIESGALTVGQPIFFAPRGDTAVVKAILRFSKNMASASAGENVGIVCDVGALAVKRGDVCCCVNEIATAKSEVMTHAIFLESPAQHATVECGTAQTECEIGHPFLPGVGEVATVGLRFKEPMVVERSKTALGRLALKRQGRIIGVAVVL